MGKNKNIFRIFEARIRDNGRIFSRHIEARSPEHARKRLKRWHVISIKKVSPQDIIGNIEMMQLEQIIGKEVIDTYSEELTLEGILFPKRGVKSKRRFTNEGKREGARGGSD